jgi:pilus assembly protein Flp/PilA
LDAIRKNFRRLLADQAGATAIEYGLIVAMIAVAAIGGFSAVGGGNGGMWSTLNIIIQTATA